MVKQQKSRVLSDHFRAILKTLDEISGSRGASSYEQLKQLAFDATRIKTINRILFDLRFLREDGNGVHFVNQDLKNIFHLNFLYENVDPGRFDGYLMCNGMIES
jgi:hypothetical protein